MKIESSKILISIIQHVLIHFRRTMAPLCYNNFPTSMTHPRLELLQNIIMELHLSLFLLFSIAVTQVGGGEYVLS